MMHCTPTILKMYLDENIKQLERDRRYHSDPWVTLQGAPVPSVADGKPLRETLSDEFEEDDISQGGR